MNRLSQFIVSDRLKNKLSLKHFYFAKCFFKKTILMDQSPALWKKKKKHEI